MKKTILTIAMTALLGNVFGQQVVCGSQLNFQEIQQTDPARYQRIMDLENKLKQIQQNPQNVPTGTIIIPVVVHVVYNLNNPTQNISDEQIFSQIKVLNEDFRRLNADRVNTPAVFAAVAGDANIEFRLATKDPNGNSTDGITRTPTGKSGFDHNGADKDNVKFTSKGGHDAWNTQRYLNIWVCSLSLQGLRGYAQFPEGMITSPNTDGVVIGYQYFGVGGHTALNFNKGRTTTHEVGHWLNLYHIFGIEGNCNIPDGEVDDIPRQRDATKGCRTFPATDNCTSGDGVMFMNFMDYSDDACMNMFSIGQIARMRALFDTQEGIRREILTFSESLTAPAIVGLDFICDNTSENYRIVGLPENQIPIVQWTSSNNIALSGIGTTAIATRNSNCPVGTRCSAWIKATVTISGNTFELPQKNIILDAVPNTANISSSRNNGNIFHGNNCVTEDFVYYHGAPIKAGNIYGITDVEWASSGLSLVSMTIHNDPFLGIYGTITKISAPSFFGSAEFQIKLKNHCGWGNWKPIVYNEGLPCPSGGLDPPCFTCWQVDIYPNPVDDVLSIVFKHLPIQENQTQRSKTTSYSVKLYDMQGNVLRQTEFTHTNKTNINFELNQLNSRTEPVNFNVSNLKEGTYYLHIEGNGEIEKKQIVVKRR